MNPTIRHVLVIDDSEADQIIAQFAIEDFDSSIRIDSAPDGRLAFELLQHADQTPDLILLDINMPGMDGHAFLKEYAGLKHSETAVVVLSSSIEPRDKVRCFDHPFVKGYLSKPISSKDLAHICGII